MKPIIMPFKGKAPKTFV